MRTNKSKKAFVPSVTTGKYSPVTTANQVSVPTADPASDLPVTEIPLDHIDLSRNYRKSYDHERLQEFANGIAAVGFIISPVTLRSTTSGRYELVVGFRRYFGAQLAGLTSLPGIVRELTDEQVEEIQLQENIQREDPHPMHEAQAIFRFYDRKLKSEDIAQRLGKSVTWVYRRFKLCGLLPVIQDMFLADVFTLTQAYEIADLSPEAQQSFYDQYGKNWTHRKQSSQALSTVLGLFRCDLEDAAFDVRDGELVPAAGACTNCTYNTAFGGLLLPDPDARGKCTRLKCFENKTQVHYEQTITRDLQAEQPVAFITDGEIPDRYLDVLVKIKGANAIPVHQTEEITLIEPPELPLREDFEMEDYPDEDDSSEDNTAEPGDPQITFDQEGYDDAMADYKEDLKQYEAEIAGPRAMKGYLLTDDEVRVAFYFPEPSHRIGSPKTPASRKIKELIAVNQDTVEDLQDAISMLKQKEVRAKELDQEKVQKVVHETLQKNSVEQTASTVLTEADRLATRWLVFDAVTHYVRGEVLAKLKIPVGPKWSADEVYGAIAALTEEQFAFLVRMALIGKADSKLPTTMAGYYLLRVAESAGVDVGKIQAKQEKRAQTRQDNTEVKIGLYKHRIKKHQSKNAA